MLDAGLIRVCSLSPTLQPGGRSQRRFGTDACERLLSAVLAAATVFSSRRLQASLAFSMAPSNFARMSVFSLSSVAIVFILIWFLPVLCYVSAIVGCRVPRFISGSRCGGGCNDCNG